jgi:hypothetical protein
VERRSRVLVLATAAVVLVTALAGQVLIAGNEPTASAQGTRGPNVAPTPGNTLISIQSYGEYGRAIEVTPGGEVVWAFDPPDSRVFDAEVLDNGNVLVSVATKRPPEECPATELRVNENECVENRVLELDYSSKEVVLKYTWYDERMENHEVHDADRLPGGGTAIADMGNDRAFIVNESGAIVWEWQAENHLSRGTPFYEEYGGEPDPGGEADWTHLNDIDRLPDGDLQLSIRNFDVVIEVDRESKEITDVIGQPGNHSYLYEQHDPNRVAGGETILVADSENDRIVEIDTETGRVIWEFGGDGLLTWPRDADRLPNGNTLIADTQNDRVLEVNPGGEIVWRYRGADFLYSADRIGVSEDAGAYPSGRGYEDRMVTDPVGGALRTLRSYAQFVVPPWMGSSEALTTLLLVLTGIGLVVESGREIRHRRT